MTPATALELAAAASTAAAGVVVLRRSLGPLTGGLLLGAAGAFTVAALPTGRDLPFTLALVSTGLAPLLTAAAGAAWPLAPRTAPERRMAVAVGVAVAVVALLRGLVPALLFDPVAGGCYACARNLLEVHAANDGAATADRLGAALTVLVGPALAALAALRFVRAPLLTRRHAWPVLGAGAAVALLQAVAAARSLALPDGEVDGLVGAVGQLQCALAGALAAGVAYRLYLAGTANRRVTRAVLAAVPDPDALLASLRHTLRDPTLTVTFIRDDDSAIDLAGRPAGRPARPGAELGVLRLARAGVVFAEVRHDPRIGDDLVRAAAAAAGLALEYFAAQARLRAELLDAARTRQRIVEDGDAERGRLERNLHDGAQQQLIALAVALAATGPSAAAQREIAEALQELRTIARGLFPTSLAEAGVTAALRELGDHTSSPLLVSGDVPADLTLPARMAVYRLVLDVARSTGSAATGPASNGSASTGAAEPVSVHLSGGGNEARVSVTTTLADPEAARRSVINAEDRLVAAGGRLDITRRDAALRFEGVVPCGS